jgi:hypothetical protein
LIVIIADAKEGFPERSGLPVHLAKLFRNLFRQVLEEGVTTQTKAQGLQWYHIIRGYVPQIHVRSDLLYEPDLLPFLGSFPENILGSDLG